MLRIVWLELPSARTRSVPKGGVVRDVLDIHTAAMALAVKHTNMTDVGRDKVIDSVR